MIPSWWFSILRWLAAWVAGGGILLGAVGALSAPGAGRSHSFLACGGDTRIVGADGTTLWSHPASTRDGYVLRNGHVLMAVSRGDRYPGGAVVEVTRKGEVVFEWKGTQSEVNTVQPLSGGRILATEAGDRPRIVELNRSGRVLVEVPIRCQTTNHHMETRMTRKLGNGNYLVPQLLDQVVREYDREGRIVWEVRTPNWPFTAIRLANGNTVIGCTVGNLVIEVDRAGRTVWQLTNDDLPDRLISDACGVQRLPEGNTVLTSYRTRPGEARMFEVNPAKEVIWRYSDRSTHGIHHFQILDTNGRKVSWPPRK